MMAYLIACWASSDDAVHRVRGYRCMLWHQFRGDQHVHDFHTRLHAIAKGASSPSRAIAALYCVIRSTSMPSAAGSKLDWQVIGPMQARYQPDRPKKPGTASAITLAAGSHSGAVITLCNTLPSNRWGCSYLVVVVHMWHKVCRQAGSDHQL